MMSRWYHMIFMMSLWRQGFFEYPPSIYRYTAIQTFNVHLNCALRGFWMQTKPIYFHFTLNCMLEAVAVPLNIFIITILIINLWIVKEVDRRHSHWLMPLSKWNLKTFLHHCRSKLNNVSSARLYNKQTIKSYFSFFTRFNNVHDQVQSSIDPIHALMNKCIEFKWTPSIMIHSTEWTTKNGIPVLVNDCRTKFQRNISNCNDNTLALITAPR